MFHTIDEAAMVDIAIAPDEYPILVFRLVVQKLADVDVSIDVLQTIAVLAVILEMALIESQSCCFVDQKAVAMVQVVAGLPEIERAHVFAEEQLPVVFKMFGCDLLKLLVGIVAKLFLCLLFVLKQVLNKSLFAIEQLRIEMDLAGLRLLHLVIFVHYNYINGEGK